MRLGCTGCLGALLGVALVALVLGGAAVVGYRALVPVDFEAPATSAADGTRAQQKIFSLARKDRRGATVVLTEAELNALLDRHLVEAGGTRLAGLSARLLGEDRVDLRAHTSLERLLDEAGLRTVTGVLPARWRSRPVHLRVGGHVTVEATPSPHLRFEVDGLTVGRQAVPPPALRLLVDPATVGLLRWRLPEYIERVGVEPGRVVIRTRPGAPPS
jgi:hypothetical protein